MLKKKRVTGNIKAVVKTSWSRMKHI